MVDMVALIIVIVVNSVFVLLVLSRNLRKLQNILYAGMIIWLMIWTTLNYFSNQIMSYEAQLLVNRLSFASALILVIAVWLFSIYFPSKNREHTLQRWTAAVLVPPVFLLMALSSLMVEAVHYDAERQVTDVISGPLYIIYVLTVVLFFGFLVKNFYGAYRSKTTDPLARQQIIYTATGILFTFLWSLVTTTIWPQLTGNWEISKLGIIGSLFLGSFIGVAIVKHRLFDIRLIVARTLGYILSIVALAVVYGFVAFSIIGNLVFDGSTSVVVQQTTYTILAVILAFTFQPLKRFFDKLTNRLFYQDAYEAQSLLNDLNSSLVSSIDVSSIMKNTSLLIEHYLKPEYAGFYVFGSNEMASKIFNTDEKTHISLEEVRELCEKSENKTLNLADVSSLPLVIQDLANDKDMGLLAQLVSSDKENETVGAIVLGQKKSGSLYGRQDFRVMEIIADELVIAIQNALRFEEIQQFNVTLQGKVDKATAELRKANEKLIAMDQTKDDFISMASHQLRTPLTSVKGYVSMVLEGDVGKITKEQRKLLDQSFLSAQRMVYLIADLLNVSRLKTGKFIIEPKPTNLADVVEGELEQLKETAAARNLEMTYEKPKDFPVLNLDETKIRQVIMNFADNAIYYTPSGGHIKVGLVDKGDSIEFTVTDDGIGVPKSEQHNLFNKFYRAGNAKKARPDGTGLGLFMAKKVVIAQGGAIIFKTEEGKGSTFGFSFEKKKLTPETHSVQFDESQDDSSGEDQSDSKTPPEASKQPEKAKKA